MKLIFRFLNWINPNRIHYYRHPENLYAYILLPGKMATEETFRQNFPDAIEITKYRYDRLVFTKTAKMVVYADDTDIDQMNAYV